MNVNYVCNNCGRMITPLGRNHWLHVNDGDYNGCSSPERDSSLTKFIKVVIFAVALVGCGLLFAA